MTDTVCVGGEFIEPGQQKTVELPVARLYTHTEATMPVRVIRGKKPGPSLFVSAAIHGDEINGVEIIRRLLRNKALRRLKGTLFVVPVVNTFGFINRSRYLPDRRDLNRHFPGSERGSLASRIASIFMEEVVSHCTHGIDLHTGSNYRVNLPQIRAYMEDEETDRLARAFDAPIILDANIRDGSLRQAVLEKNIPMLLYEGGEALRFDEVAIRVGLKGIVSVMRAINMLPRRPRHTLQPHPTVAQTSTWMRAERSGILQTATSLGARVEKDDLLGAISDPFGESEIKVMAPISGIVIGLTRLPLVNQGEALFHIAAFESLHSAELATRAVFAQLDPEFDFAGPF